MKYTSQNVDQTYIIAQKLASQLRGDEVICLYGDLGSGKTVIAKGLIQFFIPNQRILSPTFIIVRHYKIVNNKIKNIFHADLYRIDSIKEIEHFEFMEFINKSGNVVIIEWADRLKSLLPVRRIDIYIKNIGLNERSIDLKWMK